MSLAQRVRDFRYSKGWGPDELANRAEISRTALYQIESGKTELPRAGTLRRIAMALDVSMETLLGHSEAMTSPGRGPRLGGQGNGHSGWARPATEWYPSEGAPMTTPARPGPRHEGADTLRYTSDFGGPTVAPFEAVPATRDRDRERELVTKFQELLATPFGDGLARVVDEAYRLVSPSMSVVAAPVTGRVH